MANPDFLIKKACRFRNVQYVIQDVNYTNPNCSKKKLQRNTYDATILLKFRQKCPYSKISSKSRLMSNYRQKLS